MAYTQVSPIKIGTKVEHNGRFFKIVNHQKPDKYARQYIIQSFETGQIHKVFRHEIFQVPVAVGIPSTSFKTQNVSLVIPATSTCTTATQAQSEPMFDSEKLSQSDEEMLELEFDLEVPTHNDEDLNDLNKILEVEESVPLEPIKMRFKPVPSQQKIDTIAMARTEQTTNRQTTWGVKLFRGWLKENNLQTDFEMTDVPTLNERLKIFYASLQTKNGEEYSKSALIGIRAALSRHLTSPPYNREISLMKDREFMTSNHVMLGLVKIIKREGRDVTIHKKAVSEGDIDKLYSSEVFSLDSAVTLQNKVFWDIMLNFGRRGQEGLHALKKSSYAKFTDDVGRSFYKMTYNESNKTHHGVDNRENEQVQRMYGNNRDTCPVKSLDLYLSKLSPKCDALFQQPLQYPKQTCWYAAQPMGKNKLAGMMARISKTAGLSKRYTNHCIKATVATGLKKAGVDLLSIMSVTGHRNVKSLDSYIEGPTDQDRRQLSANLQNLGSETSNKQLTPVNVFDSVDGGSHTVALQSSQISNISKNPISDIKILNGANITGGTFTFNVVNKD